MYKKISLLSTSLALAAVLAAGCATNQGDLGNRNIRQNAVRYDANGNLISNINNLNSKRFANDQMNEMNRVNGRRLNSNNIVGSHKNYKIEMSDKIAEKVTQMNTVKSSYVMLTDNNAYVAVSFEDHHNHAGSKAMSRTNMRSMDNSNGHVHNNMNAMSTGEEALTEQVKADIAKEVKRMHPTVENVYVSANPDFVGRMNSYMNDVRLGHPIQGFVSEFNAMAERIFPANASRLMTKSERYPSRQIFD